MSWVVGVVQGLPSAVGGTASLLSFAACTAATPCVQRARFKVTNQHNNRVTVGRQGQCGGLGGRTVGGAPGLALDTFLGLTASHTWRIFEG